jgi:pimeloyl-ACP methyl ester carboxylesterase
MSVANITTAPVAAPTVVLLHSSGSSSRQWDALAETLRPTCRVVAMEFHGHGARPAGSGAAGSCPVADAALLDPLLADAGGVHLIGHSYGGAVALQVAAAHPGQVRSVAVFEPVLFRLLIEDEPNSPLVRELFEVVADMTTSLAEHCPMDAAQRFVEFWTGPREWLAMPAGRRRAIAARMATVIGHFHGLFGAPSPRRALASLEMPVLCLTGSQTVPATRRIRDLLADLLGAGLHETLPGMGHMGPISHAEHVNRRLLAFLAEQMRGNAVPQRERVAA